MEINNEEDAGAMITEWRQLPTPARKRAIQLAIQRLELNCMYYEQKKNVQGMDRCERCLLILRDHLATLAD